MGVTLQAKDLAGNTITSVAAGQSFNLQVWVDDYRYIAEASANYVTDPDGDQYNPNPLGISSAFVDILYNAGAFDFDSVTGLKSGSGSPGLGAASYNAVTSSDGKLERVGTIQTSLAYGNGLARLWVTVPMIAESTLGQFTISAQHPVTNETFPNTTEGNQQRRAFIDNNPSVLLAGGSVALNPNEVDYSGATLTLEIVEPGAPVDIELRIVKTPTAVDSNGEINSNMLPNDAEWLDEWDNFYVEVYATAPDSYYLKTVTLTLNFTNSYHNVLSFSDASNDSSLKFTTSGKSYNNGTSNVTVTFSTALNGLGDNGKSALLGRIYFGPDTGTGAGVANAATTDYPAPVDTKFTLTSGAAGVQLNSSAPVEPAILSIGSSTNADLFAVPYDLDDDKAISLVDLTYIVRNIGTPVTTSNKLYRMDYTHDGYIDLVDLAMMIRNIGTSTTNAKSSPRIYYSGFPYFGSAMGLMEGESITLSGNAGFVLEGESIVQESTPIENTTSTTASIPSSTTSSTYVPLFIAEPTTSVTIESESDPEVDSALVGQETIGSALTTDGDAQTLLIIDAAEQSLKEESTSDSDAVDEVFADLAVEDPHLTM